MQKEKGTNVVNRIVNKLKGKELEFFINKKGKYGGDYQEVLVDFVTDYNQHLEDKKAGITFNNYSEERIGKVKNTEKRAAYKEAYKALKEFAVDKQVSAVIKVEKDKVLVEQVVNRLKAKNLLSLIRSKEQEGSTYYEIFTDTAIRYKKEIERGRIVNKTLEAGGMF